MEEDIVIYPASPMASTSHRVTFHGPMEPILTANGGEGEQVKDVRSLAPGPN